MIVQGSNSPISILFDEDMRDVTEWSISLYGEDKRGAPCVLLKHWGTEDLSFDEDGTLVTAPMTEEETMSFPPCVSTLEIKWMPLDGVVFHTDTMRIRIVGRNDKTILGPIRGG